MTEPEHDSQPIRYERRRKLMITLIVTLLLAFILATGFFLGQKAAYSGTGMDPDSYRALQAELAVLQARLQLRVSDLDVQRTRHEVDRSAMELVRRELATQKEQIAGLEESLGFYRSLMAPEETSRGLSLREIELVPGRAPGRYAYRIVVKQEARKHKLLKGDLSATVLGTEDGEQVEYSLAELSDEIDTEAFLLQFRYFQSLEGEITLPKGFEPRGVSVVARARTPHKLEVREEFSWQLQERFTHVGK